MALAKGDTRGHFHNFVRAPTLCSQGQFPCEIRLAEQAKMEGEKTCDSDGRCPHRKCSAIGYEVHSTVKPWQSACKPHKALVHGAQISACLPKQELPKMPDLFLFDSHVSFHLQQ